MDELTQTEISEQKPNQEELPRRFRCDQVDRIGSFCFGLLLLVPMIFFLFYVIHKDGILSTNAVAEKILGISLSVFMALILTNAFIRTSDIFVSDRGIRHRIFRKFLYEIQWSDIKRIRVLRATKMADSSKPIDQYFLDTTLSFHFPNTKDAPFMFTTRYENVRELLDIINNQVTKYGIDIVDCRNGSKGRLERL